MFRQVALPEGINGGLLLHSMPGLHESWNTWRSDAERAALDQLVSLTDMAEIEQKSPEFARAIREGDVPVERREFAIQDYGVPPDRDAFAQFASEIATSIRAGRNVLIHCGAGIGRSGTLAASVLIALGAGLDEALQGVRQAGAGPETQEQRDLVRWMSDSYDGG